MKTESNWPNLLSHSEKENKIKMVKMLAIMTNYA